MKQNKLEVGSLVKVYSNKTVAGKTIVLLFRITKITEKGTCQAEAIKNTESGFLEYFQNKITFKLSSMKLMRAGMTYWAHTMGENETQESVVASNEAIRAERAKVIEERNKRWELIEKMAKKICESSVTYSLLESRDGDWVYRAEIPPTKGNNLNKHYLLIRVESVPFNEYDSNYKKYRGGVVALGIDENMGMGNYEADSVEGIITEYIASRILRG